MAHDDFSEQYGCHIFSSDGPALGIPRLANYNSGGAQLGFFMPNSFMTGDYRYMLANHTVREIALTYPGATRTFEQLQIDYCCGGEQSLSQACAAAGVTVEKVAQMLAQAVPPAEATIDFTALSLSELISHIEATHHAYTRQEIDRLLPLLDKVCAAHRGAHPELLQVKQIFKTLADELEPHLCKEEMVLFGFVRALEAARQEGKKLTPHFGTVCNPVRMMSLEHEHAGQLLRALRAAGNGYELPPDACASYQALYAGLAAFERDLHQHIHLENNILFPRAVALEQ